MKKQNYRNRSSITKTEEENILSNPYMPGRNLTIIRGNPGIGKTHLLIGVTINHE